MLKYILFDQINSIYPIAEFGDYFLSMNNKAPPDSWDDTTRHSLMKAVQQQVLEGKTSDTGLKMEAWGKIQIEFKHANDIFYSKSQLQSQLGQLSRKFKILKALKNNSGFGFDPVNNMPTAPKEYWDAYLSAFHSAD